MSPDPGAVAPGDHRATRALLVADHTVGGGEFRRALTARTDEWLAALFDDALAVTGATAEDLALVALGGYGRGELWPNSDLDVAVIHRRRDDAAAAVAEAVWYPVWDSGVHLGHSVRSIAEAVGVVGDDIETSTALLDARFLAGDAGVAAALSAQVLAAWKESLPAATRWLRADATARRDRVGDVAFSVEPNVKAGGGGLRDSQIVAWLRKGGVVIGPADVAALAEAQAWLGDVRVALHRCSTASGDVLRLEDQDAVAELSGVTDADDLMTQVARGARSIDWVLDEAWVQADSHLAANRRRGRHGSSTSPAVEPGTDWDLTDPAAVFARLAEVARGDARLGRPLLSRLAAELTAPAGVWNTGLRDAFVALLAAGPGMIRVVEALDQVGVWERFLPEWDGVRTRAQRTTHHRFTVDRHLLETVALAASFADRVARGDLLVVAALLHDLGKGRGGDHTAIGVELVDQIAPRMGFDADDTATIRALVAHHLLLPEAATRRDIDDAATIRGVARAVTSVEVLGLLLALTEADARSTGPAAWTDWKAGLVHTLVERVGAVLTGTRADHFGRSFPSDAQRLLLDSGDTVIRGEGRTVTVVAPDRPGLFCRVAGALVLAGLNVVAAEVTSADGMALEEFTVTPAFASPEIAATMTIDWARVVADVELAMAGRTALAARVADRAATYRRRLLSADTGVRVRFDDVGDETTGFETVVEVDAPDRMGVLFAITHALAELDIDIHYARVESQTERVIDAFSIVDATGGPVTDDAFRAEIERAIRHALNG